MTASQAGTSSALNTPQPRLSREQRHADGRGRKDEADEQSVEHDDADVAGPAAKAPDGLVSTRRQQLPERHRGKNGGEGAQADDGLVRKQDLGHKSCL